ncbi:MAG TPA: hypothetical protein VGO61_05335 [Steroidobacteraceae bacterium]|nr:hypothetical protein [Steroidobacteraceae bacterium]
MLPLLAAAQDPVDVPGTADTTPPDPTIIHPITNLDPLSDDPGAGIDRSAAPTPPPEFAYDIPDPVHMALVDRAHLQVWRFVWRSAMRMDTKFGGDYDDTVYQNTSGSLAPAFLWDEFDGFQPRVRFQVDVPLPHLNERLHAFVGRVNRDEYVTERKQDSGALASQYGPVEEDETLLGLRYREPRQGGRFEADAGLRIRSPLDPFVKGSYRFMHGTSEKALWSLRETAFWQNSEKFGLTSRIDFERIFNDAWLLRWAGSVTYSQETEGGKGYTALTMMRGLPNRRAVALELFTTGKFVDPVPTENYGVKLAYRRSIARDWLVLETRLSCTFPRELITQERKATVGVGIGLEMFFGTDEFLARPVTF